VLKGMHKRKAVFYMNRHTIKKCGSHKFTLSFVTFAKCYDESKFKPEEIADKARVLIKERSIDKIFKQ